MTTTTHNLDLAMASATQLAAALRDRQVSSRELLDTYLERIAKLGEGRR